MKKTKDQVRLEALTVVRKFRKAGAAISMGVGKTRLCLEHLQLVINKVQSERLLPAKALVVAPTKKILKGWVDEIEKWKLDHLLEYITFSTYRSMDKHDPDFDVIYLDECHSLKESHDDWLSMHTGRILGVTGTPPKYKGSEKGRMIAKYCPMLYEYLMEDAVEDKILNDYRLIVHLIPLGTTKNHKVEIKDSKTGEVKKFWYTSEKENYDYWTKRIESAPSGSARNMMSIMRMKAMQTFRSKEVYAKQLLSEAENQCIVFANTQDQADRLCTHSFHSGNPDSNKNMEMFEQKQIQLLSCVLQLSEGANIRGLAEAIIMHAYGNNKKAAQRIGRILRLSPDEIAVAHILCYIDTVDVEWVKAALEQFSDQKIEWYDPNEI